MGNGFDFSVERLVGAGVGERIEPASASSRYTVPPQEEDTDPKIGHYESPTAGTFYLETFGCQMNEHDSERLAGLLVADGLEQTSELDQADVIVLNTCCIRRRWPGCCWRGDTSRWNGRTRPA
jgi:Uncharacterized protein family UPF0004